MIERYTRPEMGALFTEEHKFDTWLRVELAVCDAWAGQGAIPKAALDRIKRKARFELTRINEIESQVQHDLVAFTTAVGEHIGADSAFFHKGLTSSDVVDTAQSLVLKQAGQLIERGLLGLKTALGRQALTHKRTPVIGRTHGVHAEPTTFGLKLLVWYDELARHEERLGAAIDNLAVGKLSGAVGNFAHIPPEFEEAVLKQLGLQPAPVSNQVVQRDRHAQFVCALALLGATLEKMAINLRTLQRTEIGEAQEPFTAGQKGSSAMPHKMNPVLLERIAGLARVLRGYAVTALENVALWDERDISHSGAERVILPDACALADYMLSKMQGVIENLVVRPERMERNIYLTKGLIFSQRVLLALTEAGLPREAAYTIVQRNALRCWQDATPLLDALLADREVRDVLSAPQISALFALEPYLAHVERIFERVGLIDAAAVKAEAPPQPVKAARGGRGRARRAPVAAPTLPPPVESGAVQNIAERPSDWYETAALTAKAGRTLIDAPDETLGEAEHQRDARQKRGAKRKTATPGGAPRRSSRPRSAAAAKAASSPSPTGASPAAAPAEQGAPASVMPPPASATPSPTTPAAAAPHPRTSAAPHPRASAAPHPRARAASPPRAPATPPPGSAASPPPVSAASPPPASAVPGPATPAAPGSAAPVAAGAESEAPKKRRRGTRGGRRKRGDNSSSPTAPAGDRDDSYVD
jgi:adenylosuccinate lyase